MRILFVLFALMPIIEVTLLVQVGAVIGGWNTLAIVLLSAFIGAYFVKREGLATLQNAQAKMQRNELPGKEMAEGLMLVIAGVLLVTPGFITDIVGILFVLPGTRGLLAKFVMKHMQMRVVTQGAYQQPQNPFDRRNEQGDVFEGEFTDKTQHADENHRLK